MATKTTRPKKGADQMIERIVRAELIAPPVPLSYANAVLVTSALHELTFDFFQMLPVPPNSGEGTKSPGVHVARVAIPFTMLKDFRDILDRQVTSVESRMGPLKKGSELLKADRSAVTVRATPVARSTKGPAR